MCQGILECEVLVGTRSAEGSMASGHVNRIKRPDTWLHRPMLQNVKKVLANPEPSTHDPNETFAASNPDERHSLLHCVGLENANWSRGRHNSRKFELSVGQEPCKFAARTLPTSRRHHQHL